ncbi:oxygenase MpaB family protein [Actinoplanes sp. NEAU-A12]|uniref:Oxygenase MpaB family protein n=1 Tax=Actinoplanes sandaracinus TaxID=3045177 RepID=A0ABT6WU67_9ACTN|nr:oxygenase MpaB family protein [Actinoplanes sandaracinus]MDI6103160.1 oxygenase MpaB family protein [Actinoplanes sandaracinus]
MNTHTDPRVPSRFAADRTWSERAARPLRLVAGPGADPTPAESAALAAGLLRRDELAAELVRAVRPGELHRALVAGPAADAPEPVRAFFDAVSRRPSWVDDGLLARGAEACRAFGMDAGLVLAYGSLLGGYRTSAALEPLVRTGRLAGGETLRRIQETSLWWRAVTAPGGLAPDGEGFRLTLHVRVMHAVVNARLEADPTWDRALRGLPVNQYDQASTLGVFSTSFLLHLRLLGVRVSRADAAAVMHLWSYVGWLMGVDEQWLPHTERRGRRLLYHFLAHDPPPDRNSVALARALIHMTDDVTDGRRRLYERERALSVSCWLLGPAAMRDLGLPYRPPWYGLARVAANLLVSHGLGRLPGGRARLLARSERQAEAQFRRWGATLRS